MIGYWDTFLQSERNLAINLVFLIMVNLLFGRRCKHVEEFFSDHVTLFFRSHDQNRTASDSTFQRQFYHSTGFDSKYTNIHPAPSIHLPRGTVVDVVQKWLIYVLTGSFVVQPGPFLKHWKVLKHEGPCCVLKRDFISLQNFINATCVINSNYQCRWNIYRPLCISQLKPRPPEPRT